MDKKIKLPPNWVTLRYGDHKEHKLVVYPCPICWGPVKIERPICPLGLNSVMISCSDSECHRLHPQVVSHSRNLQSAILIWNNRQGGLIGQLMIEVALAAGRQVKLLPVHLQIARMLANSNFLQAMANGNPEQLDPLFDEVNPMKLDFTGMFIDQLEV